MADNRQRFQGKCLQSYEGYRFMKSDFDEMPPTVRARMASSDYNLCAACVWENGASIAAIEQMEAMIRAEEHEQQV